MKRNRANREERLTLRQRVDRLRARLWRLATLVIVLVAVYVVVLRELVAMAPGFREPVEALASEALGLPVVVQGLEGRMDGLSPVIELTGLEISPPDGEASPLRVGRVALTLDVLPSVLHRQLRARQLQVDGLRLTVRQDDEGRVTLRGLEALQARPGPRRDPRQLLNMLYRQNRLVFNDLDITAELNGLPAIRFPDVRLALLSSGEQHRLAVMASASDSPLKLDLRLNLDADAYSLADIHGDAYLALSAANLAPWLQRFLPQGLTLSAVGGEVEAWGQLRAGVLSQASVDLGLASVAVSGEPLSSPLSLDRLDLLAHVRQRGEVYEGSLVKAAVQDDDALVVLPAISWRFRPADPAPEWALAAADADLAELAAMLSRLPIPWPEAADQGMKTLSAMALSGRLEHLFAAGQGRQATSFSARFRDVTAQPVGKAPGFSGVSGWLAGDDNTGVVMLDSDRMSLVLPKLFVAPLRAAVSAPLAWQRAEGNTELRTGWVRVSNRDAAGRAIATVRLRPQALPELSLLASLRRGRGDHVDQYIPLVRLPEAASRWLDNAFLGGHVPEGRFLHEGPVRIDPNRQQDRTLQMAFAFEDLGLHYLDGWPDLEDGRGEVYLDGREIRGRGISARILDTVISRASADIPEYEHAEVPTVIVSGLVSGPAANISSVLLETPLRDALPAAVTEWSLTDGQVRGNLLLHWPLPQDAPGKMFIARTDLSDATLVSESLGLSLEALGGDLFFHLQNGISSDALSGQFMGGEIAARMATRDGNLILSGDGSASSAAVIDWLGVTVPEVSGDANYEASLALPWGRDGDARLSLASDLVGVTLEVPSPLDKAAGQAQPLQLDVTLAETLEVRAASKDWLNADLRFQAGRLQRGEVSIGRPAAPPIYQGLHISGRLPALAVESWVDWLGARPDGGSDLFINGIDVDVAALDIYGFPAGQVTLAMEPQGKDWAIEASGPKLAGSVVIPDGYQQRGNRPLVIDIQMLTLDTSVLADGDELDPLQVPVMDVSAIGLDVDGENMGNWRVKVRPSVSGISLNDIKASWRGTQFVGRGSWDTEEGLQTTRYVGGARTYDLASAMRLWDVPALVESKDASAVLDLSWDGSPFDLDYLKTRGAVSVDIGESRILDTGNRTNALRMLGIFNLNSVSRRLRLDFSDLYKKGLTCDEISGDFAVAGERVSTRNFVIRSPSAEFRVKGMLDMAAESVQQEVQVTLPTSSSLYLGCFAGAAACAGVFVVERLWGDRFEKLTSLTYSVTGPWQNPKVKEL